jgi:EAL domain-containing protein (putative c-di-GMP-specific phosphodiesterase class I)
VSRRLATETSLQRALERQEFVLYYQPLIDLASGRIDGAEALLRWPQADGRLVSPADFIPIAEDSGLIVPLGEWVLREACREAKSWQHHQPGLRIAVNISPRQFRQGNLVTIVQDALRESGLAPQLLELELTEGMLMQHADETLQMLDHLHALGVRLAIDDFGTGYSSLSYLKRFPIHTLKVDRSFVKDLETDNDDAAIVSAVISMAHGLDLHVVAEGVETEAQARHLQALACDLVQGYHFGRPVPAPQFVARLRQESAAIA